MVKIKDSWAARNKRKDLFRYFDDVIFKEIIAK